MRNCKGAIAIVDDDEGVRKALKRLLGAAGFEARAFGSAEEFLPEAESGRYACLMLDIKLPGMSGFELYGCLEARGVHLPAVFITADEKNRDRAAALHIDQRLCLCKPFPDSVLLGALSSALSGASLPAANTRGGASPRTP